MSVRAGIYPCLWFDREAERAAGLYTRLFPNSSITAVSRYGEGAPLPAGTALMVAFELDGVKFTGLNGGPMFRPNEAVSFVVECDTQAQIDHYWNGLTADGGAPSMCGWLKDPFGFSWQIVPAQLGQWMGSGPPERAARVMAAMLGMQKMIIAELEAAYHGG